MASNNWCFCFFLFALLIGLASSAFISDDVFESHGSTGRTLLQAAKACTLDLEHKNYTIITSQCKGPNYQAAICCTALKQFACPFSEEINDLSTDCATTMFSYINIYGKYPQALFASLCKGDKDGLTCTDQDIESAKNLVKKNGVPPKCTQSSMLIVTAGFLMLLFQLF